MNLSDNEKKQVKEVFLNETKGIIPQALADIKKLKDIDQKKLPNLSLDQCIIPVPVLT